MSDRTVNVFYVGNFANLDTVQFNNIMEDADTLLGSYDVGSDISYHYLTSAQDPRAMDELVATNDVGASESNPEGSYEDGYDNTVSGGYSRIDSHQIFKADVNYIDIDGVEKTMSDVYMNVYQLENGDVYMAPSTDTGTDLGNSIASLLSGREITNVQLTELQNISQDGLFFLSESVHDEVQTFYLGNKDILDTEQGNGTMEGAGDLLGTYDATAGTPGDGQFTLHTLRTHHDPLVNDGLLATNDYGASTSNPDGKYDEGFSNAPTAGQNGTTFSELDSQQLFWGEVYYLDDEGNEQVYHNAALNVYQLENGDVFAVPTREIVDGYGVVNDPSDDTPSILAGMNITRIELTSMREDGIGRDSLIYDSESIGDAGGDSAASLGFSGDGIVDGTDGDDLMNPGYTDAQTDQIDDADCANTGSSGVGDGVEDTRPTVNVFYVGNMANLDTVQGNGEMEEADTLLGSYGVGSDINYHTLTIAEDTRALDGLVSTNDYGASDTQPNGSFRDGYDNTVSGGFSRLDSHQVFNADVTYRDIDGVVKTMSDVPMNVYQMENGDVYMAPNADVGGDEPGSQIASALSGREILNVELTEQANIGEDSLFFAWESVHDEVQTVDFC